jgi:hypothetical protein
MNVFKRNGKVWGSAGSRQPLQRQLFQKPTLSCSKVGLTDVGVWCFEKVVQ